jgi:hypothetical protein
MKWFVRVALTWRAVYARYLYLPKTPWLLMPLHLPTASDRLSSR